MKAVLQRVSQARVEIDGECVGSCGKGFLILLGVSVGDERADAEVLARKIAGMRVFSDEAGKMNRALSDFGGEVLVVSQFTLLADCRKGNRPDFFGAARPAAAIPLYEYFLALLGERIPHVAHGTFGADMQVSLCNDGPVTILLDSRDLLKKNAGEEGTV